MTIHRLRGPHDPRGLIGYGQRPPHALWPHGARIAVQFVLNHTQDGEHDVLNRVLRSFERRRLPCTVFGIAQVLQRDPASVAAYRELGHEIAGHGLRASDAQQMDEATERAQMNDAVEILREITGRAPLGWYTGGDSPNTRRLVVEHGGFVYDSDSYVDDLPFWTEIEVEALGAMRRVPHLVVPYAHARDPMRVATSPPDTLADEGFFSSLQSAFDTLYREGGPVGAGNPKMLSIGLHPGTLGRHAEMAALERFLDHIVDHERVWICRRIDIARHWAAVHPPRRSVAITPV